MMKNHETCEFGEVYPRSIDHPVLGVPGGECTCGSGIPLVLIYASIYFFVWLSCFRVLVK